MRNVHITRRTLIILLLTPVMALAANPRLAPDLANVAPGATVPVIVRYKVQPQGRHHQLVEQYGGTLKRSLELVKGALYEVPASALETLANAPDVEYITPDRPVKAMLDYAEPATTANVAFQSGWTGAGVTVAVIDSGIMDTHPDLWTPAGKSRVVYANVYNPNVGADTWDRYGHGNHVSGILGGNAAMSSGSAYTRTFRGIAPQVQFVNLRVLDGSGAGTDSMVIAAIQAAISLKSTYKIRIINMSLGRAVFESYKLDPLCQAVEQAWKAGIVVVVAAGNDGRNNTYATDGYGTITAPGNDPYVITVGAMNDVKTLTRADDKMASYSSKGPTLFDHVVKPDIVAPGNKIIAAEPDSLYLANNFPGNRVPESYYMAGGSSSQLSEYYFTLSGTSMAAPMVSGSAALLLQQTPSLTPDQVKARLMMTATKSFPASTTATDPVTGIVYTDYNDIFTVGAGYLDTWAALNNTDLATEPALSPTAVYNSTTGTVSLVNAANVIWGSNVIWGTNVIWGSSVVSAANVIWGTNAVWGSSTLQGFSAVWGSNVIWGSSAAAAGETSSLSINGDK